MTLKCKNCGDVRHCGHSCMDCWECPDCGCEECEPTKTNLDEDGFPYPTGDD